MHSPFEYRIYRWKNKNGQRNGQIEKPKSLELIRGRAANTALSKRINVARSRGA